MKLYECILTRNDCYQRGRNILPLGVMVHSTGANNPSLRRYVQPDDGRLGDNPHNNDWNRPGVNKCVHAFIGRLEDDTVATYQTLPWDCRGWHAGGKANDTHIGFEVCEDGLSSPKYFQEIYREAVELTAYLCETFDLDPLADGVVISHREGYRRGIASAHGDIDHWLKLYGKTMDDFRAEVAREMEGNRMTERERFDKLMEDWLARRNQLPAADWGEEWEKAKAWAEENGIIRGDESGNMMYQGFTTRQAQIMLMYREARRQGLPG